LAEPAAATPPGPPSLPDYLREFLGQFLVDPQRVNPQMAGEFLREFYLRAGEMFPAAREYAQAQLTQIDLWRSGLQDSAGG
jgi:hypothetical protein